MSMRVRKLIALFLVLISNRNKCDEKYSQPVQDLQFVKLIQKRVYFIHRLEKSIQSLFKFFGHKQSEKNLFRIKDGSSTAFKPGIYQHFSHHIIKKYMQEAENTASMAPIYKLFGDFLAFKFIEDELFEKEMIIVILLLYEYVITNNIAAHIKDYGKEFISNYSEIAGTGVDALSAQVTLKLIEKMVHAEEIYFSQLKTHNPRPSFDQAVANQTINLHDDLDSTVHLLDESHEGTDFITNNNMRYYHIHRLMKSVMMLSKCQGLGDCTMWQEGWEQVLSTLTFSHGSIKQCAHHIKQTKNIKPLLKLWHQFSSYNYIDDAQFLREFVLLIYVVYHQCLNCVAKNKQPISPQELLELYQKIASLPIPELLNALDIVVEQLIVIMEDYEISSPMPFWHWLYKYWWFGPVVIAAFLTHALTIYTPAPLP